MEKPKDIAELEEIISEFLESSYKIRAEEEFCDLLCGEYSDEELSGLLAKVMAKNKKQPHLIGYTISYLFYQLINEGWVKLTLNGSDGGETDEERKIKLVEVAGEEDRITMIFKDQPDLASVAMSCLSVDVKILDKKGKPPEPPMTFFLRKVLKERKGKQ